MNLKSGSAWAELEHKIIIATEIRARMMIKIRPCAVTSTLAHV